jgi:hypothetical protein
VRIGDWTGTALGCCRWSRCRLLSRWSVVVVRDRRTLRAEELSGDVQGLTSHNDDLLAVEQLLGDGAGQATEKVTLAVDDLGAS